MFSTVSLSAVNSLQCIERTPIYLPRDDGFPQRDSGMALSVLYDDER